MIGVIVSGFICFMLIKCLFVAFITILMRVHYFFSLTESFISKPFLKPSVVVCNLQLTMMWFCFIV